MECQRCGIELWGNKTKHDTKDDCIATLKDLVSVEQREKAQMQHPAWLAKWMEEHPTHMAHWGWRQAPSRLL